MAEEQAVPLRRPALVFIALLLTLFLVELLGQVQTHVIVPFTSSLAGVSAWLISAFGGLAQASSKVLSNPQTGFSVSVETGCNGVEACIVLIAGMLAYPAPWRYRLIGLALGLLAVQSVNLLRIISLFYIAQWKPSWFGFAHEYLWQGLIMLDVLVVFMVWLQRMPRAGSTRDAPPAAA